MLRPIGSQVRIDEMDRAESGVESTLEISLSTLTSGAGLTSGHAKGFVGVVEILPARDPAVRMYTRAATTRRIASVMRRAAPNRQLGAASTSSVAIAQDAASAS